MAVVSQHWCFSKFIHIHTNHLGTVQFNKDSDSAFKPGWEIGTLRLLDHPTLSREGLGNSFQGTSHKTGFHQIRSEITVSTLDLLFCPI